MYLFTNHLNFTEHWESYSISCSNVGFDLLVSTRLFLSKLVAWECHNLEVGTVFHIHLLQLFVVTVSDTSLSRHIDNQHGFVLIICPLAQWALDPVDICHFN